MSPSTFQDVMRDSMWVRIGGPLETIQISDCGEEGTEMCRGRREGTSPEPLSVWAGQPGKKNSLMFRFPDWSSALSNIEKGVLTLRTSGSASN
jgi:hypothetical protein